MLFKRKEEPPHIRELKRGEQRVQRLLKAYEHLLERGEVNPELISPAIHQRKIVLQLFSIPDDLELIQFTLAFLWDSFEYIESGGVTAKPVIPGHDYYLNKLKHLDVIRCYNCLFHFRKAEHVCPNCGTSIQWLIP